MKRFWEKVKIGSSSECWEWIAGKDFDGYGQFRLDRTTRSAHRIAWELIYGGIPEGLCVLHHCDNPACVNPKHLFLGTQIDNIRDRDKKGRVAHNYGEKNGRGTAKLTKKDVFEIRKLLQRGLTQKEIAEMFGVVHQTISKIAIGIRWVWLKGAQDEMSI